MELSEEQFNRLCAAFIQKHLLHAGGWPGNQVNGDWFETVVGSVVADTMLVLAGSTTVEDYEQADSHAARSFVGPPPKPVDEWDAEECKAWLRVHGKRWWRRG